MMFFTPARTAECVPAPITLWSPVPTRPKSAPTWLSVPFTTVLYVARPVLPLPEPTSA